MPVTNKTQMSMALVAQESSSQAEDTNRPEAEIVRRPRQPSSLQGLLRFAVDATRADDAPVNTEYQPMDEERRTFLENALKSMNVDVVEILQQEIELLKKVEQIKPGDDVTAYKDAIETILEHIDNIDIANDFHKIGGFMILYPCLRCPNPRIRAGGCEILAVLCQNNPYCQNIILDNEFLPMLVKRIEKDEDTIVVVKALYALSGIVRDNEEGFNQLVQNNGLIVLLNTLKKNNEKFIIKATFLLTSLCRSQVELKERLVELGYLPTLITLISAERSASHEYILSLLVCLMEDNTAAIEECKNPKYSLKDFLQKYISRVRHRDECQEEEEYCKRILHILNATT